jgi:hypothetical protein
MIIMAKNNGGKSGSPKSNFGLKTTAPRPSAKFTTKGGYTPPKANIPMLPGGSNQ